MTILIVVIQFARLSGFSTIATTASLHNADLLKSLGATHVIDRKLDIAGEVKKIFSSPPQLIYDAISGDTQEQAWEILAPGGTLLLVHFPRDGLKNPTTDGKKVFNVFGSAHAQREFSVPLYAHLSEYVASGKIVVSDYFRFVSGTVLTSFQPNPVDILPNGLAGIVEGLKRSEEGKVSGVKLVIRPQETP